MRAALLIGLFAAVSAHAQPRPAAPPPPMPEVAALMGHYGSGLREVIVHEDDAGHLAAHADGRAIRLVRTATRRYTALGGPAWLGAALHFLPDSGQAHLLAAGDRTFVRRATGPSEGAVFRIQPLRPVEEIIRAARTTPSPFGHVRTADLVDLTRVIPHLMLDVRYATANNFMGAALYTRAAAYLHRSAAAALARVQRDLAADGLGLVLYDAYRPWYVTKAFWDATPPAQRGFVAPPSDGSRHNRGGAVDLGLVSLQTGQVIEMPSDYDEFTDRAAPGYPGGSRRARYYRALLRETMARHGFTVNPTEWWHYDYRDWRRYPVLNLSFEELGAAGR